MRKTPIVHIGLHKTGTSYLQQELFPNIPGIDLYRGFETHRDLINKKSDAQILISDESISGDLFGGGYGADFYKNLDRIKELYKTPKIILGIKAQLGFIVSVYKQYLHQKGTENFDAVFNLEDTGLITKEELLLMPKIEYLLANFEQVFIYSQESLLSQPHDFLAALLQFLELDANTEVKKSKSGKVNVGVRTNFQVNTLKRANKLNKQLEKVHPALGLYSKVLRKLRITPRDFTQNYLAKVSSSKFNISEELKSEINSYYEQDWENASNHISYSFTKD